MPLEVRCWRAAQKEGWQHHHLDDCAFLRRFLSDTRKTELNDSFN